MDMAEAKDRDPITKLVKSAISLQIPKEVFKHLKKLSFYSIIPDDERDRVIHFNACEQVEFYWESELGSNVPVWARKGDFTLTLPKGISAIVAWGQYILDDVLKDEPKDEELKEGKVTKNEVPEGEILGDGMLKVEDEEATPISLGHERPDLD